METIFRGTQDHCDTESSSRRKRAKPNYSELKLEFIKRHHLEEKECFGGNV